MASAKPERQFIRENIRIEILITVLFLAEQVWWQQKSVGGLVQDAEKSAGRHLGVGRVGAIIGGFDLVLFQF